MDRSFRAAMSLLLWAAVCFPAPAKGQAQGVPSIRKVQVLRSTGQVEIEIEASDRIVPRANIITGPDRLIIDFVNAVPGAQLRNQKVNREEVKNLRVGLFSSNPPVTRVVLDLNGPQPYQVFPSGRTVIVKIGGGGNREASASRPVSGPVLVNTNYASHATLSVAPEPVAPRPPLEVSFVNGQLSISSNKATLSEVLFAVHERTGAEIAIPAGAEQEKVAAELGPAPAPEVLSHLLNGSKFNFLILSSATNPQVLDRVILSSRPEGPMPPPRPQARVVDDTDDAEPEPRPEPKPAASAPSEKPLGDPSHPQESPPTGVTDTPD